jgi:hypothetical protein
MLRCRLHGGTARHGRHLSEDEHHSISFSKARAARGPLYPLDPELGGRIRAQQAPRGPDGRFLPGRLYPPHPDAHVRKAQKIIEALMAKNARLRVVPDDPGVDQDPGRDEAVPEPRTAPLEAQAAVPEPQAAAIESSAEAPPEGPDEAGELLEALMGAMLEAPSPFDEGDQASSLWAVVASQLTDELCVEIDNWLERRWG